MSFRQISLIHIHIGVAIGPCHGSSTQRPLSLAQHARNAHVDKEPLPVRTAQDTANETAADHKHRVGKSQSTRLRRVVPQRQREDPSRREEAEAVGRSAGRGRDEHWRHQEQASVLGESRPAFGDIHAHREQQPESKSQSP